MINNNRPEILAPAGGMESVIAAVRNGADAIYLGAKEFSARKSAHNFDEQELTEAVKYCHEHNVAVHQAVNIIIKNDEIDDLVSCVKTAVKCGVDAIIVQDLGAARIIKEVCPEMPLHASTQLSVHTADGVRLMKQLGFDRVVLSRELSLDEIRVIADSTDIELEVFVHGALCMSVSGQCYFSAMIGSRSGNRGLCAQPCRLQFATKNSEDNHALSLKDLCTIESIKQLSDMGIASFKIEGRMKRPEYVAAAVKAYRDMLDKGEADISELKAVFSRSGFTNGYLEANRGKNMFGYRRKDDVVAANSVLKSLKNSYNKEIQNVPVSMSVKFLADNPIEISMTDGNFSVVVCGSVPEKAMNVPMSEEKLTASLQKLGGTPYYLNDIKIELEDGITVPVSHINELRRELTAKLTQYRTKIEVRNVNEFEQISGDRHFGEKALWGRYKKVSDISDYALQNLSKIILPIDEVLRACISDELKQKLVVELPRALFGSEEVFKQQLEQLKKLSINEVMANNIASVYTAKSLGFDVNGGFSLNVANNYTVATLADLGLKSFMVSPELQLTELNELKAKIPMGLFAFGNLPLMLTRNCPVNSTVSCEECKKSSCLYDRKDIAFPVECSKGYTEVLNSTPIYMADRLREITAPDYLVLYFTREQNFDEIIKAYKTAIKPESKTYTRGLYYRGVI